MLVLTKHLLRQGDWALSYHSMKCRQLFPNLLRSWVLCRLAAREEACVYHVSK